MAIPSWLTVTPKEGSNNKEISLVASELTGRSPRSGSVHGATKGTSEIASATDDLPVNQTGKAEHITLDSGQTAKSVVATGGTVTVTGVTNCGVLKLASTSTVISGVTATLQIDKESGSTISWSDVSGWNGITSTTVTGEPGETHEYRFKITFTIPANESALARKHILSLTNGGTSVSSAQITITQLTGTKTYSEITISSVECGSLPANGNMQTVKVTYSQTWGWNGSTTGGGTISTGAETYIGESADCKAEIYGDMRLHFDAGTDFYTANHELGEYVVTVKLNNKEAHKTFSVVGDANAIVRVATSQMSGAAFYYNTMTAANTSNSPIIVYNNPNLWSILCTFSSGTSVEYYDEDTGSVNSVLLGNFQIDFGQIFKKKSGNSNMTVDSDTGVVTSDMGTVWSSGRSCVVTLTTEFNSTNTAVPSIKCDVVSEDVDATCSQEKNLITSISISNFSITYSKSVPASGSTSVTPNVKQPTVTYKYTSGKSSSSAPKDESGNSPISLSATITYSPGTAKNGFSTANTASGAMTAESRGTTEGAARNSDTITATLNETMSPTTIATAAGQAELTATATASDYATQIANTASYGDVIITGDYTEENDIPAGGGSRASISTYKASQTVTYTSGSTREGIVSSKWGTAVNPGSKGTTVSDRNSVGTLTVTATGEGSKYATKSYTVYQAANVITNYGDVTIMQTSPVSIVPAGQTYVMNTAIAQTMTYTSGATRSITGATSKSWNVKTICEGFSLDKNTNSVTITQNPGVTQRGPYVVTYSVTGEGSKTATKNITFTQQAASSYIIFNPNSLTFIAAGETKTVTVSSNDSWTLS